MLKLVKLYSSLGVKLNFLFLGLTDLVPCPDCPISAVLDILHSSTVEMGWSGHRTTMTDPALDKIFVSIEIKGLVYFLLSMCNSFFPQFY